MEYRLTIKRQLLALQDLIIFSILLIIAFFLIGNYDGFGIELYIYFILFFGVNALLVFIVHFQYYMLSKHTSLIIQNSNIQIKKGGKEQIISFNEIQSVQVFVMPSLYRGSSIQILPFENYHYALILTPKDTYIVTSLMMKDIYKVFKECNVNVKKKKCIYPYIPRHVDVANL